MTRPVWLPELAPVNGEWAVILRRLYDIFSADFKTQTCNYQETQVHWDTEVSPDSPYEEGFWHLITKDAQKGSERLFDPRRAERLPWCGPTIRNSPDDAIKTWEHRGAKNRVRTYLWLEDWDYVVVLEKQKRCGGIRYFLITAFHVDGESTRRSLRRKHSQRESG